PGPVRRRRLRHHLAKPGDKLEQFGPRCRSLLRHADNGPAADEEAHAPAVFAEPGAHLWPENVAGRGRVLGPHVVERIEGIIVELEIRATELRAYFCEESFAGDRDRFVLARARNECAGEIALHRRSVDRRHLVVEIEHADVSASPEAW